MMGIKTKIKKVLAHKEYLPIVHPVSENNEFNEKVALISGGSGGIGLSIAKSLKESGCDVVVAGTNEKKLSRIKDEFGFDTVVMDYSKPDIFDSVISGVVEKHNKIDIFINSAGVHTENVDFWSIFRKNCASVPEERSAIPLQTEQSSAGLLVTVVYSTIPAREFKTICLGCHSA